MNTEQQAYNPASVATANATLAAIQRQQLIEKLIALAKSGELTREQIDEAVRAGLLPEEFAELSLFERARLWLACLQPEILWGYITSNPQTTIRGAFKAAMLIFAAFNVHLPDVAQTAILEAVLALWSVYETTKGIYRYDSKHKQLTRFLQSPYHKGLQP